MSAIAGVFRFDGGPVAAAELGTLVGAMSDYGPEAGVWAPETPEAPVALGCRPWRATPEDARYRPPLRSADGRLVLVADARLDNREELAAELGIGSGAAAELPDAAFILAAWQAWESGCPRRLLGDFAFLIWDQRRRSLFVVRDGIGQRVLFHHTAPDRFLAATSAGALLASPRVRPRLNEQKVAEFLVLLQDEETTFFDGIRRLRPGHLLEASAGGVREERFWSPEPVRKIVFGSDREYVDGFLDVFGKAVRARLRSTTPLGVMLSGGLDSGSVAAVAAAQLRETGHRLTAFHAAPRPGFAGPVGPGMVADESGDVEEIAGLHPNLDLRIRRPDGRTPFHDVEAAFRAIGAPARNPGNQPWFDGIYAAAGTEGIRVLLSGHKGNATISYAGVRSLRDLARRGHWRHVWREAGALAQVYGTRRWNVLRAQVLEPLGPAALAGGLPWRGRARPAPLWEATASAVSPAFAAAVGLEDRVRAARRDQLQVRRMGELEFRIAALTAGVDAMDAYSAFRPWFGVETRDPTADLRVVEYCFSIPGSQYLRLGVNRWLIRRAMEGLLPDRVRLRRTHGAQSADWTEWLPAMRPELAAELDRLERCDAARRCLDLGRLRALLDRWPEQLGSEHESDYKLLLLRGMMMGRFLRWFEAEWASSR